MSVLTTPRQSQVRRSRPGAARRSPEAPSNRTVMQLFRRVRCFMPIRGNEGEQRLEVFKY